VLVLVDGIGDVTIPAFGDKTPLQVAHTPNMDCIAGQQQQGYASSNSLLLRSWISRSCAVPAVICGGVAWCCYCMPCWH
jgi:hypothetical protein